MRPEEASRLQFGHAARLADHALARFFLEPAWLLALEALERAAPGRRFARALDVGCGAGALLARLAPRCGATVGLDVAAPMLQLAERRAGALVAQGTARRLPFKPDSFDLVVSTLSFHHFEEPARSAHEMARVLAPGGLLVLVDLERRGLVGHAIDAVARAFERSHVALASGPDLAKAFATAGLADIQLAARTRRMLPLLAGSARRR